MDFAVRRCFLITSSAACGFLLIAVSKAQTNQPPGQIEYRPSYQTPVSYDPYGTARVYSSPSHTPGRILSYMDDNRDSYGNRYFGRDSYDRSRNVSRFGSREDRSQDARYPERSSIDYSRKGSRFNDRSDRYSDDRHLEREHHGDSRNSSRFVNRDNRDGRDLGRDDYDAGGRNRFKYSRLFGQSGRYSSGRYGAHSSRFGRDRSQSNSSRYADYTATECTCLTNPAEATSTTKLWAGGWSSPTLVKTSPNGRWAVLSCTKSPCVTELPVSNGSTEMACLDNTVVYCCLMPTTVSLTTPKRAKRRKRTTTASTTTATTAAVCVVTDPAPPTPCPFNTPVPQLGVSSSDGCPVSDSVIQPESCVQVISSCEVYSENPTAIAMTPGVPVVLVPPEYPNYPASVDCAWAFTAPSCYSLKIAILEFNVQGDPEQFASCPDAVRIAGSTNYCDTFCPPFADIFISANHGRVRMSLATDATITGHFKFLISTSPTASCCP